MNILYSEKEITNEMRLLLPFFLILFVPLLLVELGIIRTVIVLVVLASILYGVYFRTVKITDHSLIFGSELFKSKINFSDIQSVEVKELPETVSFGLVDVIAFGPKRKLNGITHSTVITRKSKKALTYITSRDAADFSKRLKDAMSNQ